MTWNPNIFETRWGILAFTLSALFVNQSLKNWIRLSSHMRASLVFGFVWTWVGVHYGAPFVKILYLTDLAQKLLSLAKTAISIIFLQTAPRSTSQACKYKNAIIMAATINDHNDHCNDHNDHPMTIHDLRQQPMTLFWMTFLLLS